jgi:DNA-binding transcriptional ArsR family regulator
MRKMNGDADIAAAAALLSEPTRAALVTAVMDEGALPASDLAGRAGVAVSTASEHLTKLVEGNFLASEKKGRRRYYRLATPAVAAAVEALAVVAPRTRIQSLREATRSERLREARTCYDHLAGRLGVALARALERNGMLVREDAGYRLGPDAQARLAPLGIDLAELERHRRPVVRGCMDWSEGELHLAGALGASIASRCMESGWVRRRKGERSVEVTPAGAERLRALVGLDLRAQNPTPSNAALRAGSSV